MEPAAIPGRARRIVRRILLAGVTGIAWLSLSAAGASAADIPAYALIPGGTSTAVATAGPDREEDTLELPPADSDAEEEVERTPDRVTGPPSESGPDDDVESHDPVTGPPTAAEPDDDVESRVTPALVTPAPALPAPNAPAANPVVHVPDPTVPDPTVPAPTVPAPAIPDPTVSDPTGPDPDPTLPAVDPLLTVPDPDGVLPVIDPAVPLPDPSDPVALNPVPEEADPAPGDSAATPEVSDASTPVPSAESAATPAVQAGPPAGIDAVKEAPARKPAAQGLAGRGTRGLPPPYVPPPGSYPALLADTPLTSGEQPGSVAAVPPEPPAQGDDGTPPPSGNDSPLQGGPAMPAPESLPAAPGSGSTSGQSTNGPTGTAAWLPGLHFYLPTTGADPIHGPLQHAYSTVSADPGSSPD